jgi:hypothetical protein
VKIELEQSSLKKSAKKIKHHKKGKAVATKLRHRPKAKRTSLHKHVSKPKSKFRPKAKRPLAKQPAAAKPSKKVVRIMGMGQFTVDARTLKRLNGIDDSLVEMVASERAEDAEFKKGLAELSSVVVKHGKPVERGEIVKSDIILPSADLPVDEAKKMFRGSGVISGT